jgi:hypothetical protein
MITGPIPISNYLLQQIERALEENIGTGTLSTRFEQLGYDTFVLRT